VGYFGYVSLFPSEERPAVANAPPKPAAPAPTQHPEEPPAQDPAGSRTEVAATTPAADVVESTPAATKGPSGGFKGRVIDPNDNPLADVLVQAFRGPAAIPIATARVRIDVDAHTDENGNFTIEGLTPGDDYILVASHTQYAAGEAGPLQVAADEVRPVATIKLKGGLVVFGKVTDQGGSPLRNVSLSITDTQLAPSFREGKERKPFKTVLSDEQGDYRFEKPHVQELRDLRLPRWVRDPGADQDQLPRGGHGEEVRLPARQGPLDPGAREIRGQRAARGCEG
jgi:protocatechuate 3,4-dioxygenase beta subunit